MKKIVLELSYGNLTIYNLHSVFIQPLTMMPGYMLCYEDDVYERGIIYRANDKQVLLDYQDKLINSYNEGKTLIRLK